MMNKWRSNGLVYMQRGQMSCTSRGLALVGAWTSSPLVMGGKAEHTSTDTGKLADVVTAAYGNSHPPVSIFSLKWEVTSSVKSEDGEK